MANKVQSNKKNNNSQENNQNEMRFGDVERQCCEFGIYCPKL